jgi:PAS domain S-box-containing protein
MASIDQALKTQRRTGRTFVLLLVVFALAGMMGYFIVKDAVTKTVEQQSLAIAEIVASQATTARSVYAKEIAAKLKADGFGPDVNFATMPGHVPIPAQFLKLVGLASSEKVDRLYEYKPVSKWNLEPSQGLSDDFLRWAWPQLERQDQATPSGPIAWKAVSRLELKPDGSRVLRYLSADPASQAACAACHNAYEKRPEFLALRQSNGIEAGRQWNQHQLMGALSITVPLDKAEKLAGTQTTQTSIFFFGILIVSFLAMFWFNWRMSKQALKLQAAKAQLDNADLQSSLRASEAARVERELALAQIQEQQAFTARLIDVSPVPTYVKDSAGMLRMVNQAWCNFTGLSAPQALAQGAQASWQSFDPSDANVSDLQLMAGSASASFEVRMLGPNGAMRDVVVNKTVYLDGQGRVAGLIGALVDVSQFREAERHTRAAKDAADQSNAAKTEFVANMSHELRTPLQSIIGFSELGLSRFPENPKVGLSFKRVHDAGLRMLGLVNNLLDLTRPELLNRDLDLHSLPVAPLLQEVIGELQEQALARRASLVLEQPDDGASVVAMLNPGGIKQVMQNLLANALRFTPQGGQVRVSFSRATLTQGCRVRVLDQGPGIPQAELDSIFEPFVLSSRTKDGSGGTGLGLAICRRILNAHGASIRAENRPEGGACFSIEFALAAPLQ